MEKSNWECCSLLKKGKSKCQLLIYKEGNLTWTAVQIQVIGL